MNFFKSKDPDIVEVSREKRVKDAIVAELRACLRNIQSTQQARRPGEPIYTSDSSNQLCTVFEAVLLHGHKTTRGIKRQQFDSKAFEHCSFWPLVQRVTHKGTIGQLKSLVYIKTETGFCRAWVRLAVNDGLIESYFSALLAQPKVLSQYYNKTAFLRDIEQPGILVKLIQVLEAANYDFQLVYNSSLLNDWVAKTMALAGLIEQQFLFDGASSSPAKSRSSTLDMDDIGGEIVFSNAQIKGLSNLVGSQSSSMASCSLDRTDNSPAGTLLESRGVDDSDRDDKGVAGPSATRRPCQTIQNTLQTFNDTENVFDSNSYSNLHPFINGEDGAVIGSPDVDAKKELARLRTASYNIDDFIHPPSPSEKEDATDSVIDEFVGRSEPECSFFSNHGSHANLASNHSSPHNSAELTCEPHPSEEAELVEDKKSNIPTQPSILNKDLTYEHEEEAHVASFVFGTPQSHPDFLSSGQQDNLDDEAEVRSYPTLEVQEEAGGNSFGDAHYPLSAAQAIMSRAAQGTQATSSKKGALSGCSFGSHGNSLASLSGWENGESPAEPQEAVLENIQSYADLVSEYKQAEAEALGSPISGSQLTAAVTAAKKVTVEETSRSDSPDSTQAASTVATIDGDLADFEVVGDEEKDEYADALAHYGELCNEEGLASQNYTCFTCSAPIGIIYGDPRVCSYTKKYYCSECHLDDELSIPAKIIYNWDWSKYKVCKNSRDFLCSAESMPLLDVNYLNPSLYEHIPTLGKVRQLRTQLFYLKRYLFACNPKVADELKQMFSLKEYLFEEIHTYSVQDLWSVNSSLTLTNQIKKAVKFARKHVQGCESCEYRGFLCEICGNTQVIFPFDLDTTSRCHKCSAVYHQTCFTNDCPKCERVRQRKAFLSNSPECQFTDIEDDFSMLHI
ncbi:pleckstrin homology domain-containing family M member 1-like [Watersipora subatra]|uniref:pleckstrin homology domain-containing family M member 1-like n=1 Tax=Watersipora subatra TaxID=2589382 RepID=UPI00355C1887